MRPFLFLTVMILLISCSQQNTKTEKLQAQIDSLTYKLDNSYKPGLGEFMGQIQVHHGKLWFAGTNNNWELADFEMNEILETVENIQKFNKDRVEVKSIGMINQPLDSLDFAIKQKNTEHFKRSFILLTNTCNNCHKDTKHAFNVITIPSDPPFGNQSFKRQ